MMPNDQKEFVIFHILTQLRIKFDIGLMTPCRIGHNSKLGRRVISLPFYFIQFALEVG